jgi:hypothetical protein
MFSFPRFFNNKRPIADLQDSFISYVHDFLSSNIIITVHEKWKRLRCDVLDGTVERLQQVKESNHSPSPPLKLSLRFTQQRLHDVRVRKI